MAWQYGYGYQHKNRVAVNDIISVGTKLLKDGDIDLNIDWRDRHVRKAYIDEENFADTARYGVGRNSGAYRGTVIFLRHAQLIVHLMHDFHPAIFPGPAPGAPQNQVVAGIASEDISRVKCLMSFIGYKQRQLRKGSGDTNLWAKVAPDTRRGFSEDTAVVPALYRFEGGPALPDAREAAQQMYATGMQRLTEMAAQRFAGVNDPSATEEDLQKMDEVANHFGLSRGGRLKKKNKKAALLQSLPAIDPAIRDAAIKNLCRPLQIIHDRDEETARAEALDGERVADALSLTRLSSIIGDLATEGEGVGNSKKLAVETDVEDAIQRARTGDRHFLELLASWSISTEDLENVDLHDAVKKVNDTKISSAFRNLQNSINSVSAFPPQYDEVVERFGFTVTPSENGVPLVNHFGVMLLPHQVVAVSFLVDMLESKLRSAALLDETGLGKTIQALSSDRQLHAHIREALAKENRKSMPDPPYLLP